MNGSGGCCERRRGKNKTGYGASFIYNQNFSRVKRVVPKLHWAPSAAPSGGEIAVGAALSRDGSELSPK